MPAVHLTKAFDNSLFGDVVVAATKETVATAATAAMTAVEAAAAAMTTAAATTTVSTMRARGRVGDNNVDD